MASDYVASLYRGDGLRRDAGAGSARGRQRTGWATTSSRPRSGPRTRTASSRWAAISTPTDDPRSGRQRLRLNARSSSSPACSRTTTAPTRCGSSTSSGHEHGGFNEGSVYHLQQVALRGETIKFALIMDGIGWSEIAPLNRNVVWSYDAETHRVAGIFDTVRAEYGIDIGFLEGTGSYSDNQSYWNAGLPASLSIGGWPYQAPGYHGCGDTVDVVDFANIFKIAEQNLAVLLKLDAETAPPTAAFTATPTAGDAPLTVQFTDLSTGAPSSWSWDFGDPGSGAANTSTAQRPEPHVHGRRVIHRQAHRHDLGRFEHGHQERVHHGRRRRGSATVVAAVASSTFTNNSDTGGKYPMLAFDGNSATYWHIDSNNAAGIPSGTTPGGSRPTSVHRPPSTRSSSTSARPSAARRSARTSRSGSAPTRPSRRAPTRSPGRSAATPSRSCRSASTP